MEKSFHIARDDFPLQPLSIAAPGFHVTQYRGGVWAAFFFWRRNILLSCRKSLQTSSRFVFKSATRKWSHFATLQYWRHQPTTWPSLYILFSFKWNPGIVCFSEHFLYPENNYILDKSRGFQVVGFKQNTYTHTTRGRVCIPPDHILISWQCVILINSWLKVFWSFV